MKRSILLSILITSIFISCAPYKMKAIRAQRDHRYDLAVKFALRHLSAHPDDQSTIDLLNGSTRGYYTDLQKKIQHFENLNDWEMVVRLAEQGYRILSDVTQVVGTDFPRKEDLNYLQAKSEQSKFNRANEFYMTGMKQYQNGDLLEALESFKACESQVKHFKDTEQVVGEIKQKLAGQKYQQAKNLLSQGKLESALESFMQASQYVPDFLDIPQQLDRIRDQLAVTHFNEGKNYFDSANYNAAYDALKKSLGYKPNYQEADQLFHDVKDKLTVRLAVFPFTASKLDVKLGEMASQQILSQALPRKSEFILFLERENLQKIFEEQALSQTGAIDEKTAVQVGKLSGVNTIVLGSVTRISGDLTNPIKRTVTGHFKKKYRDPKGVERTTEVPFNYTEYEVERRVEVNLSYRLVNVETGVIMFNESISKQVSDHAQWITCPTEFIDKLSASEQRKLKASKIPDAEESLISQAISALTEQAASKMMAQSAPFKNQ